MTTQQPEALRLADFLDDLDVMTPYCIMNCVSAGAELRRLHWENLKFANALKKCSRQLIDLGYSAKHADEALGKAKGETK